MLSLLCASFRGKLSKFAEKQNIPNVTTVEPVNPDSGKSGHLHITDIEPLSRIFLHLKLVFRHLKNPDTSVFRNSVSIRTAIYHNMLSSLYCTVSFCERSCEQRLFNVERHALLKI